MVRFPIGWSRRPVKEQSGHFMLGARVEIGDNGVPKLDQRRQSITGYVSVCSASDLVGSTPDRYRR